MEKSPVCYYCGSTNIVKNGRTYIEKPGVNVKHAENNLSLREKSQFNTRTKKTNRVALTGKISLEGISRAMEISADHLYSYLEELYKEVPEHLHADSSESRHIQLQLLACESNELWSFVTWKANKQWIWVAQDRVSRQIIAVYVGSRGAQGAYGLWQAINEKYKKGAVF